MEILLDAFLDSIKILPFIFLIYLLIEFVEHKNNTDLSHIFMRTGKFGPFFGALLGCIPQCGFSVIASDLFAKRAITLGTLTAVFISTSDEAIPIMLSNPGKIGLVLKIIVLKFFIALVFGIIIDLIYKTNKTKTCTVKEEHSHFHGNCESCDDGILKSAVIHSVKIFFFIFAVSLVLGFLVERIGENRLSAVLMKNSVFQPAIAAVVGLIPNCASSVILTQTYLSGAITFGSLISGLCSGAGVGLVVLFKRNKSLKENLILTVVLFLIGTLSGMIIQLF